MEASGGGKREWGEGGLGGREKVEDADDLEEVVVPLVDGVERAELSHILLVLGGYFTQALLMITGRVLVLVILAIPLSSQHSLKYAKECR